MMINGFVGQPTLPTEEQLKQTARGVGALLPKNASITATEFGKIKASFESVLLAAAAPSVVASYRVAAWNALCALIDQCATSKIDDVANAIWSLGIWDRTFDLYLYQSRNARPKSCKQLLVSISSALRRSNTTSDDKLKISRRIMHGLSHSEDLQLSKASVLIISHFLSKNVLDLSNISAALDSSSHPIIPNFDAAQRLLHTLLALVGKGDFGSAIGQAISSTLCKVVDTAEDDSIHSDPIWAEPLKRILDSDSIEIEQFRIHIFPILFKRSLTDYVQFLYLNGISELLVHHVSDMTTPPGTERNDGNILYAALQAGKDLGLLHETDGSKLVVCADSVMLPIKALKTLLQQASRQGRLAGLSLLITSHAVTRPYSPAIFSLLRKHLPVFFADTDANGRSEVFSLMQKLLDRIRAITAALARANVLHGTDCGSLLCHKRFLTWLLPFLMLELRPTASYQRHISALKTLLLVVRSGMDPDMKKEVLSKSALGETKWPFHIKVMPFQLRDVLQGLLLDPFEDVRQVAATILSMTVPAGAAEKLEFERRLSIMLDQSTKTMLSTGRADQADGVAHLLSLKYQCATPTTPSAVCTTRSQGILAKAIDKLESMLDVAKLNLIAAAKDFPLHGQLTALRYILTQYDTDDHDDATYQRLSSCLFTVWNTVKPVLCQDAPEGYELETEAASVSVSTKDSLSYCWRGLKESSLLLGVLVHRPSLHHQSLISLSELCFTQLAELRHRGAFSTVSQTWNACCIQCAQLTDSNGTKFLESCYSRILAILHGRATINTRRSAGIPALLGGLLIADTTGQLIMIAVRDLIAIAHRPVEVAYTQEASLPQVHAMNCIKDILKNSRLAEHSSKHIPEALRLAANSLRSSTWAIRNCGLMLFRAVIDRLLGTSDAHLDDDFASSRRLSAHEFPELLDITLTLLNISGTNSPSSQNEGVFAALQLLQRMQIPPEKILDAQAAILVLTANSSWHMRDKAARTYALLIATDHIALEIHWLLSLCTTKNQNALHGLLLCTKYLVFKADLATASTLDFAALQISDQHTQSSSRELLSAIISANHLYHNNDCAFTKAAYIDIYRLCLPMSPPSQSESFGIDVVSELETWTVGSDSRRPDGAILRASLASAFHAWQDYRLCLEMHSTSSADIVRIMDMMDARDPDAACVLYRSARTRRRNHETAGVPIRSLALHAGTLSTRSGDLELTCVFQQTLLALLKPVDDPASNLVSSNAPVSGITRSLEQLMSPVAKHSNQQYADQCLQLKAIVLDDMIKITKLDDLHSLDTIEQELHSIASAYKYAIADAGLYTREAAASTISYFRHLWPFMVSSNHPRISNMLYQFTITTYDLLNDDDEDLRILAATAACRLLSAADGSRRLKNGLEPIVAGDHLLALLVRRWGQNSVFVAEAISRAFGVTACSTTTASVAARLDKACQIDTALFAMEKQNLYIDDAREVRVWSRVAASLHPACIPKELLSNLARWVADGWVTLTHAIGGSEERSLSNVSSGASKADVFALGLQVIYATQFLLELVGSGAVCLPIRPSLLRQKVYEFWITKEKSAAGISALWEWEIERLMRFIIIQGVRVAERKICAIQTSLGTSDGAGNYA